MQIDISYAESSYKEITAVSIGQRDEKGTTSFSRITIQIRFFYK